MGTERKSPQAQQGRQGGGGGGGGGGGEREGGGGPGGGLRRGPAGPRGRGQGRGQRWKGLPSQVSTASRTVP